MLNLRILDEALHAVMKQSLVSYEWSEFSGKTVKMCCVWWTLQFGLLIQGKRGYDIQN
jgi:hypothetical protein